MSDDQKGFTIIELLIATTVFSLVLVVIMAASIQMGRYFYKGISESRAQNTSRQLMDTISNAIEFSGITPRTGTPQSYGALTGAYAVQSICLDKVRFSYVINLQVDDNVSGGVNTAPNVRKVRHVVWRDNNADGGCTPQNLTLDQPTSVATTAGVEIMPPGMRLTTLTIKRLTKGASPVGETRIIDVRVMYGDIGTMDTSKTPYICLDTTQGGAFCGLSELNTAVMPRLQ